MSVRYQKLDDRLPLDVKEPRVELFPCISKSTLSWIVTGTVFLSVTLFLAKLLSTPSLPIWPNRFEADTRITAAEWSTPGRTYYDWTIPAQRAFYYKWCLPLEEGGGPDPWGCEYLTIDGDIYFIRDLHPEPESRCCKINPGLGVSPPNWMGSMSYVGEEIADEVESNRWDAADGVHIYWSAKEDDRPVSIKRATTLGVTYIHFTSFEPGSSDPPGGFTLPTDLGDCSDLCIPEEQ